MTPSHYSTVTPLAGFHPTLRTDISQLRPLGQHSSCSLHLLYDLGSDIILDQYQIRQLHSEGRLVYSKRSFDNENDHHPIAGDSKGKGRPIQAELYLGGQLDLEAPVSQIDTTKHSYILLSMPVSAPSTSNLPPGYEVPAVDVTVELPLHLRYQEPVLSRYLSGENKKGYGGGWYIKNPIPQDRQDTVNVEISWPCVFWACEADQASSEDVSTSYKKMDESSSCISALPHELRTSLPTFSPAHPSTTHPHHYLLPYTSSSKDSPEGGHSFVSVPTGVFGDLDYLTITNLVLTWGAFLLIGKKVVNMARNKRRQEVVEQQQVEVEEKEKKST